MIGDEAYRLFDSGRLADLIHQKKQGLAGALSNLPKETVLGVPIDDLCASFEDEYGLYAPHLNVGAAEVVGHGETRIDVSQDRSRDVRDRSKPAYLTGNYVELGVPYEGDGGMFRLHPSVMGGLPNCYGEAVGGQLVLRHEQLSNDAAEMDRVLKLSLSNVQEVLSYVVSQVERYNSEIEPTVRANLAERKERFLKGDQMVASLSFPMRRRDGAPRTYAVPVQRRKPVIQRPQATTQPFTPEPELAQAEYEEILRIVQNMVEVMERSPSAFKGMGEEDLRQHFLVQLNGQYEGQATGETFNMGGKTDILIRADGKNVFIAECKFWTGPKGFHETIDQLLGYTSWRDTKTAILLFNSDRQLSTVLEKVPGVVEEHPNYKRTLDYASETGFRFVLHQNGDSNRDVTVTVLVFDVPK